MIHTLWQVFCPQAKTFLPSDSAHTVLKQKMFGPRAENLSLGMKIRSFSAADVWLLFLAWRSEKLVFAVPDLGSFDTGIFVFTVFMRSVVKSAVFMRSDVKTAFFMRSVVKIVVGGYGEGGPYFFHKNQPNQSSTRLSLRQARKTNYTSLAKNSRNVSYLVTSFLPSDQKFSALEQRSRRPRAEKFWSSGNSAWKSAADV